MPLVRYEIRNEYSLAKPELYTTASKDESDALLDGVAVAGLVGIVRQLGDLAEFAAAIFHDLHEDIMATAARSHELVMRMQQLEAEVPSVEKSLMSQTNQLHFAHTAGGDWHASIRIDQSHFTQTDLPRFIRNSYEECRGPPHLFTLDKFDVAGAGACLKRYTDPSFFKKEWASSALRKGENARRERNTSRLKKKIRKQRNGEIMRFPFTSQQNSRVNHSTLDLSRSTGASENLVRTSSQIEELKHVNWKIVPSTGSVHKDLTKNDSAMGQVRELKSVKLNAKDIEATGMCLDSMETFVFVDRHRKRQLELVPVNDVGSEAENYVDALTTMESEIETDSECQIKREVDSDINSEHRKSASQVPRKSYDQPVECSKSKDAASADGVQNIKARTTSEENIKQSSSLASLLESSWSEEKGSITDLHSGNQATMFISYDSSRSDNNACTTNALSVEAVHDYNNVGLSSEALSATSTKHVQIPDIVMGRSSSFAFSNSDVPSSIGHVNALADCLEKESTAALNSGKNQNIVLNSVSSGCGSITQTTDASTEAIMDDHHDAESFAKAASDAPIKISSFVQKPDSVLDRSSSFAFSKFESSDALLNATSSAYFETADAFFRFITPELSVMYSDTKFTSPSLIEEPFTISESSARVTDVKFQLCSSKIDKLCNSQIPTVSGDSNRTESVTFPDAPDHKYNEELESTLVSMIPPDTDEVESADCSDVSELASSLHDLQSEHSFNELEVDYAQYDIKSDCVCSGKSVSKHENLSSSSSEFRPVQPNIDEIHMDFPIGSLQSKHSLELSGDLSLDSVKSGIIESAVGADLINNQKLDVSSSEDAPRMKPAEMYEKSLDSSVTTYTTSDLREGEFPPDMQIFETPVNGINVPPLENGEVSGNMLGDELKSKFDKLKVDGTVLENDVNTVILKKDIPEDLMQAELASIGCIIPSSGSVSNDVCNRRPLNKFTNDETGDSVLAESPDISCCDTFTGVLLHCRSPANSTGAELCYFTSNEPKAEPLADILTGKRHAKPASISDHILLVDHLHTELLTKQLSAEFQRHHVGEPQEDYVKESSASSLTNVNLQHQELLSSPQDQLNISFYHNSFRSDYNSEIISQKRSSSVSETIYSLPEPAIPLQKELDKKGIADHESSLLNDFNKSTETVIDEMQSSKLLHTVDGSECVHQRVHAEHSSVSSDHSTEHATGATVVLGINTCNNQKLEYSKATLFSSTTNSSEPSTPRDSILLQLDNGNEEAVYNRQSIQPSPKSWKSSEPEIQLSIPQQTPPPPPVPPLNWCITRDQKRSSSFTKPATCRAPPAPPPPMSKHCRPAPNSQSQKTCIGRNDSLIKAIASHDKSMLRKVVRQSQSLKDKPLNEREELLNQIRTRSFNLRQTVVKKTQTPRPVTNINVSAILEKASAIRQAFVGSEDDEDDWSDT